jgi:hypothetical protein
MKTSKNCKRPNGAMRMAEGGDVTEAKRMSDAYRATPKMKRHTDPQVLTAGAKKMVEGVAKFIGGGSGDKAGQPRRSREEGKLPEGMTNQRGSKGKR